MKSAQELVKTHQGRKLALFLPPPTSSALFASRLSKPTGRMAPGTRPRANAAAARPGEVRVLTQEEYDDLTPAEKGSYTKALRRLGKENDLMTAGKRRKTGKSVDEKTAVVKSTRKRAATATAIDNSAGKKVKQGPGAAADLASEDRGVTDTADETALGSVSEQGTMEHVVVNAPAPSDEDTDSDLEDAKRRVLAAKGKRKQGVVTSSEEESSNVADDDEEEHDDDEEEEDGAQKTFTKAQMAKYLSTQPKWKQGDDNIVGSDLPPAVIESFNDDNDDIDLVNDARARVRAMANEAAATSTGQVTAVISSNGQQVAGAEPSTSAPAGDGAAQLKSTTEPLAKKPAARPAYRGSRTGRTVGSQSPNTAVPAVPTANALLPAAANALPAAANALPAAANALPATANALPAAANALATPANVLPAPANALAAPANALPAAANALAAPANVLPAPANALAAPANALAAPANALPAAANAPAAANNALPAAAHALPATAHIVPGAANAAPAAVNALPAAASALAGNNALAAANNALPATNNAVPASTHAVPAAANMLPAANAPPAAADALPAAANALPAAWPADTAVVSPTGKQGHWSMKAQSERVQKVLKRALKDDLPRKLFFQNVFPQPQERAAFYRAVLVAAAEAEGDMDIVERVQREREYAAALSKIPEARTSNLRGKLKDAADAVVRGAYKIDDFPADRHVRIMKWLVAEEDSLYIFPGDAKESTYDDSLPFGHSAIIMVIRMVCFGPKAIAKFPSALFRGDDGVLRLPPAMVAAGATAVEAGLRGFLLGPDTVQVDFAGNQFIRAYLNHIATLQDLKNESPGVHNALLASLYRFVTLHRGVEGNGGGVAAVGTSNRRVSAARVAQAVIA
ncbi:hypothetical protein FA95DRAFT_1612519 [Auriscalpium vulgare]|uniref:Uncharacterized protein n=1 Tax=Auriscalpium vulgare TaxID=40419 RepID=A0ACB8R619_9AGAM|nr:hypothetical protein FA95DRAFT_1612519 [Auriscalpium vulgare]